MNLTQEQKITLTGVLQHDFDQYYETIHDIVNGAFSGDLTYCLDAIDAILAALESLGESGGSYYDYDDLISLVETIPYEDVSQSTISYRINSAGYGV